MRFWESSDSGTLLNVSEPTRRTQTRWHLVIGWMALGSDNDAQQLSNSCRCVRAHHAHFAHSVTSWLKTDSSWTGGSLEKGIFCWCEGTTPCQSFLGWASQTWTLSLSFRVLIQQAFSSRAAEGQYTHTHTHTHTHWWFFRLQHCWLNKKTQSPSWFALFTLKRMLSCHWLTWRLIHSQLHHQIVSYLAAFGFDNV